MDKYNFIYDILNNKKLNSLQRDRVLKLTSSEIEKNSELGKKLQKRVEKIEEFVGINETEDNIVIDGNTIEKSIDSKNKLVEYIDPIIIYNFLLDYNQNPILKTTCHDMDANSIENIIKICKTETYDFEKHLKYIKYCFNKLVYKHEGIKDSKVKSLIYVYIFGYKDKDNKKGWSTKNIQMNWSDKKLLNWCKINKIPPNSTKEEFKNKKIKQFDEFESFNSMLTGKPVQTFRELVIHFKYLFHIRNENSLQSILKYVNKSKGYENEIDFEISNEDFPNNIELLTDIDKLVQAYNLIIGLILKQQNGESKPRVKLSFYEKGTNVYLSINHLNNSFNRTIIETVGERIGDTYTELINKQINGLCNLYLVADFGKEGYAKINLWNGEPKKEQTEGLDYFNGGVEHIFEFKK